MLTPLPNTHNHNTRLTDAISIPEVRSTEGERSEGAHHHRAQRWAHHHHTERQMKLYRTLRAIRPALQAKGMDLYGIKAKGGYKLIAKMGDSEALLGRFDDLPSALISASQALRQAA
jgi:hypothetical protein